MKKRKRKGQSEGFLEDWATSGKAPRVENLSKYTVESDKWDLEDLEHMYEEMVEFESNRDQLCDTVETGGGLWADTFWSLSKVEPKLQDDGNIRPSHLINHTVMSETMALKEYEELRSLGTVGDDVAAAMGCITMRPDLETLYDRLRKEQEAANELEEQMKELAGLEDRSEDLDKMLEELSDPNSKEGKNWQKEQALINQQMQQLQQQIKNGYENLQGALKKKQPMVRSSMKDMLGNAVDEAQGQASAGEAWGLDPGTLQRLPAAERIELAKRMNNPRLRKIAELFGPMKRMMFTEQRRKVSHAQDEVVDITKGKDLAQVLPMEFARLDDPERELLFFKDYIEGSLLQYKMEGTEKVAKGGIIYCEDGSGSMSGQNELWAKAVGLCLLNLAREQKRKFWAIHFGSSYEIMEFDFSKPENYTPDKIIDFAEFFFGGGTDFMRPLSLALDHMREEFDKEGLVKADVVFATDGACGVQDQWLKEFNEEKERLGFTVWGISIGGYYSDEPLNTICSGRVIQVKDLMGGEDIRGVFGGIGSA